MLTSTEAASMSDLSSAEWAIVARKHWFPGESMLRWQYLLPEDEIAAFRKAVTKGAVLTLHERDSDRSTVLYAKLPQAAKKRGR